MSDKNKKSDVVQKDELTGDPVLNHNYDGIKELDNPLPGWWKNTFYLTIVFAVAYFGYYEFFGGSSLQEHLISDLKDNETRVLQSEQADAGTDALKSLDEDVKKPDNIQQGKALFAVRCSSCHGSQAEGGIGPNLTDDYWIHGNGKPVAIYEVVDKGVLDKGMPPWGPMLKKNELVALVSYVYSVRGSKVNNPKAPQGNKIEN